MAKILRALLTILVSTPAPSTKLTGLEAARLADRIGTANAIRFILAAK